MTNTIYAADDPDRDDERAASEQELSETELHVALALLRQQAHERRNQ